MIVFCTEINLSKSGIALSWYKLKDDTCTNDATTNRHCPTKICWYLQIIPIFKKLFANGNDAKNLT